MCNQEVMSGNFLRHELKHYDDASVDLEDVLHNAHDLLLLVRPLFACVSKTGPNTEIFISDVTCPFFRWESWSLCLILLVISNISCCLFEVIGLAGLGYSNRKTNILAKFLPPMNFDCERMRLSPESEMDSDYDKDIAQSELMDEVRLLFCFINDITVCLTQVMLQFYALLKWQDLYTSLKCYLCLSVFVVFLHNLSTQYLFTLLLDLFLLHFPVYQYYTFLSSIRQTSLNRLHKEAWDKVDHNDIDETLDFPMYDDSINDEQNQDTDDNKMMDGDNGDVDQKSEAGSSSDEGDLVELKIGGVNAQIPSDPSGKGKRQGVVGKLLKTVKTQGQSGRCEGCKVTFTTILKRRRLCSHCGNHFCSRCCNYKVTRSMFGATAPAAQTETVNVCYYCFNYLNNTLPTKMNGDLRSIANEPNVDSKSSVKEKIQ
ncbi:hypothetical protein LSH36_98g04077 [Paralvinella palmiformis]|uniref:Protrudin n=1 Tax=Paralvinella palmiformis TaxID=53620 RepID=A0AAD9K1Z1_9ANNE|nr:hypothetical protein LSH36_98g04077 [Paralvinella palmiformis]